MGKRSKNSVKNGEVILNAPNIATSTGGDGHFSVGTEGAELGNKYGRLSVQSDGSIVLYGGLNTSEVALIGIQYEKTIVLRTQGTVSINSQSFLWNGKQVLTSS
jgi:hypothetical protein